MALGESIIGQDIYYKTDFVEIIFMEKDFLDRTVLNLISTNKYAPLLSDDKVIVLLNKLWVGKPQEKCNGMMTDFSMLTFLATAPIQCLPK